MTESGIAPERTMLLLHIPGETGMIAQDKQSIRVQVVRSSRKTIGLQIRDGETVIVRAPYKVTDSAIRDCLAKNRDWIEKHLEKARQQQAERAVAPKLTQEQIRSMAQQALKDLPERVRHFAPLAGVRYGRITIRCQRTRWGSCSSQGNLNFNCLLMLCPEEVRDYVVVHELCHRIEMNHSDRFWQEVGRVFPDYRNARKWLRTEGKKLIAGLDD